MENNQILRELSTILYGCNGIYRNTVDYMTALPTLDHVVIENSPSERKRKKNIDKMNTTLKSIRHKQFVRDALRKGMVEGVAFYYFETVKRPLSSKKIYTDFEVERIVEINEMDENINIICSQDRYKLYVPYSDSLNNLVNIGTVINAIPFCKTLQDTNQKAAFA